MTLSKPIQFNVNTLIITLFMLTDATIIIRRTRHWHLKQSHWRKTNARNEETECESRRQPIPPHLALDDQVEELESWRPRGSQRGTL